MPPPTDRGAYGREYMVLDRALASPKGILVGFSTSGEAYKFREKANKARLLDRELSRRVYREDPDHPMYGRSEYGVLVLSVIFDPKRARWLCKIEKATTDIEEMDIEEIPPDDEIEEENEDGTEGAD